MPISVNGPGSDAYPNCVLRDNAEMDNFSDILDRPGSARDLHQRGWPGRKHFPADSPESRLVPGHYRALCSGPGGPGRTSRHPNELRSDVGQQQKRRDAAKREEDVEARPILCVRQTATDLSGGDRTSTETFLATCGMSVATNARSPPSPPLPVCLAVSPSILPSPWLNVAPGDGTVQARCPVRFGLVEQAGRRVDPQQQRMVRSLRPVE